MTSHWPPHWKTLYRSRANSAVDALPPVAELAGDLADVNERLGRVDDAVAAMHEAIAAGWTGVPDGRCRIAEILTAAGRLSEATAIWEEVAAEYPDVFARWDRSHLHMFTLADGIEISPLKWWGGEEPDGILDGDKVILSRLKPGERFAYVFDLGDHWAHLCTVAERRVDPLEALGIVPDKPLPCWGWGSLPVRPPFQRRRRRIRPPAGPARRRPAPNPARLGSPITDTTTLPPPSG